MCELAKHHLCESQGKMKRWYDKKARSRVFLPGDKVLVLLPLSGSALKARYSGPYLVSRRVNKTDYVIETPERKCKT